MSRHASARLSGDNLIAFYELLAKLLGTKPIRVHLTSDTFIFRCGLTESHVRPVVWCAAAAASTTVLSVGDEAPPAGGLPVHLPSSEALALPFRVRQQALRAALARGFKTLQAEATIHRPEIIFHNDDVLATAFEGQQTESLRQASMRLGAQGVRFQ